MKQSPDHVGNSHSNESKDEDTNYFGIDWKNVDWDDYEKRCRKLEDQGMTRSDAQGIVDLEIAREQNA